jgi:hypothetical protein
LSSKITIATRRASIVREPEWLNVPVLSVLSVWSEWLKVPAIATGRASIIRELEWLNVPVLSILSIAERACPFNLSISISERACPFNLGDAVGSFGQRFGRADADADRNARPLADGVADTGGECGQLSAKTAEAGHALGRHPWLDLQGGLVW